MINIVKLFIPPVSEQSVVRKTLLDELSSSSQYPLILVTAPMGYGKSSLISHWVHENNPHYFWYSLDEFDNDFNQFIHYLSNAIPKTKSAFHKNIRTLINAQNQPSLQNFVALFANEFNDKKHQFQIVLDDYHRIENTKIHNFFIELLKFPLVKTQFVIITRVTPPFPIQMWKLKNKIVELKTNDLAFDLEELESYIKLHSKYTYTPAQLASLLKNTEGWVSGLKLWLLSKKDKNQITPIASKEHNSFDLIKDLVLEILNQYPIERSVILKLSTLNKFNSSLVEELVLPENKSRVKNVISLLEKSNLFLIPLDNNSNWFRLHHMFQEYLHHILAQEISKNEYLKIHTKVSDWFVKNDFLFEAIEHAIKAKEISTAIHLFSSIRHQLLNESNWPELTSIFQLFPEKEVVKSIELQLIKSWLSVHHGNIFELFESFESLHKQIENDNSENKLQFQAEFNCLLPYKTNNIDQDFEAGIQQCEFGLKNIADSKNYQKGYAWIFLGGALQISGKYDQAVSRITTELNKTKTNALKQNLLLVLCYIHWMEAEITELYRNAKLLAHIGDENGIDEASANGHYFLGSFYYIQNNYEEAKKHFDRFYELRYATIGVINYMGCICYSQVLLELNEIDTLQNTLATINEDVLATENQYYIKLFDLVTAEYHLANNQIDMAWQLSKGTELLPLLPFYNVYAPIFTYFKVLLYKKELSTAHATILQVSDYLKNTHNLLFLIYIQLYEVFYLVEIQNKTEALSKLKLLISKAETLNISRPFIELSNFTKPLLLELEASFKNNSFFEKILHSNKRIQNTYNLTRRELEILPLLLLSDKEISKKLFIAIKTVKRHNGSIYKKFEVNKRLEAFNKAKELNLI